MKVVKRESNIELLRLVLMFMVVVLHFFCKGVGTRFDSKMFLDRMFVVSFIICAVNTYVFISGYYGIKFKIKGVVSLLMQIFFYSITILIAMYLLGFPIVPKNIVESIFPFSSQIWWFVSMFLILYFFSPVFNIAIENFSKKQHLAFCIFLFFVNSGFGFVFENFNGYTIFPMITIYFIARYFGIYNIKIKYPFILFIVFSLCLFAIVAFCSLYPQNKEVVPFLIIKVMKYNNPIIIGSAICLFYTFKEIKINSAIINKLSAYSFGVYLIHDHYLVWKFICLDRIISPLMLKYDGFALLLSLSISVLIVYVVCLFIDFIRFKICSPLTDRISLFLERKFGMA